MEDDIDIYEDLPTFVCGTDNDENFANNKESVVDERLELKNHIEELTKKLENLKEINENLEKNLFSLLKTAKAEITRKNRMIDELKKKLDDITFKRHTHHKNDNDIAHKSNLQETIVNAHRNSRNGYFSPNQNTNEADVYDSYSMQRKDESSIKNSLVPLTIFGERVAKRIADEQNLENKDNAKKFNNKNDNSSENTEGYIIESDKENGSLTDTNISNSAEIQSFVNPSTMYKEDKCTKSSLGASKLDTANDIKRPNDKNETSSKAEEKHKSTLNTNCIGKRAQTNDETNRHDSRKRIKLHEEDNVTETIKTEVNANIESTMHINERRYSLTNSDTRHSSNKRPLEDYKNNERRDVKRRNSGLRDDRDTSKKYRDNDVSKRDDYRYNHNEYYRTKTRERDRAENYHWSRARSVSHANSYREERYGRIQHAKYSSHEDKFQKRYNFHSTNMEKSKNFEYEEDSRYGRNAIKYRTSERNSVDERITEIKRNDRYSDSESGKARSRSIERPHKQRSKNTTDSVKCLKHSELINRTSEKNDSTVEQTEPIVKIEDVQIKDERQNYVQTKLEHIPVELEDGQIFNTPDNSPCKEEQNGNGVSNNEKSIDRKLDNHLFSNINDSTSEKTTDNNVPGLNTEYVNSSKSEEITKNVSNNESFENVENIEKFINNCECSNDEADKKETVTSDIVRAPEEGTTNGIEVNVANVTADVCETNSEVTTSISKAEPIVSLDQNHCESTKELSDEKCESTLTTTCKENLVKNDPSLEVTSVNIAQDSCTDAIGTTELLKETDKGKTDESYVDNTINDTGSDVKSVGSTSPGSMKTEDRNLSVVTETRVQEEQEQGLKLSNDLPGNRKNDKDVKVKAAKASGKIIVLSRRRKPVCLTDTSANMTVHVKNKLECSNNNKQCHNT